MPKAFFLFAFVATMTLPAPAEAGPVGWRWTATPVATTQIENPRENRLMLCQLVPTLRVAGLPFWPGTPRYALAESCRGDSRLSFIAPDRIAAAQRAGLMPRAVDPVPRRDMADWLSGLWGWAFVAALVSGLSVMQRTRRRVARFASIEH